MDNAVALAAIGLAGSTIACLVWVVKKVVGDIAPALHKQSESTDEMLTFMKSLNGRLKRATKAKLEGK